MSEIYDNAVDSLKIGIEFFLKEPRNYSTRKHAILTLFHATELFMKEFLYQKNSILIYKDIDTKITEDSITIGIPGILARMENIGFALPKEERAIITKIQKRRNRIEHHRYDHAEEDDLVVADTLKFLFFFVDFGLKRKLETHIAPSALREIQHLIFKRDELYNVAMARVEAWMHDQWPKWDEQQEDTPEEFEGTLDCPVCRQSFLVFGYHDRPFCFHCNASVDAEICDDCGEIYLKGERHHCR